MFLRNESATMDNNMMTPTSTWTPWSPVSPKNADDATLAAVLPPDLYARYAALKERYAPRDRDMDELGVIKPDLARIDIREDLFSGIVD